MWKFTPTQPTVSTSGYNAIDVFNEYHIMLSEGVQNSVDAGLINKKPVHIKISLTQVDKKTLENFLFTTPEEKEHFKVSDKIPHTKESKVPVLKFEDFNTTGILGDVDDEKDGGSPMHAFLLSEGITSKEKKEGATGGSRGIGKSSFIYTSQYHTFFMSTISNEGEMHLGRAYLKPKRCVDNTHYVKDAYFVQDAEKEKIHSISNEKLENFKNIFECNRTENGTSIIILSPKYEELKTDKQFINYTITKIVEKYYFLFIENKLKVSVTNSQGTCITIEQKNIYQYMEDTNDSDSEPKKPFSSAYVSFIKNMYKEDIPKIEFNEPQDTYKGFIDRISEDEKTRFLNLYHDGKIFKAIFPYWIENRKEKISFFIQKSDEKVTETHLRRHILHVTKSAQYIRKITGQKMFIGVNILPESPTECIQQKLKDCEDENHQEWKKQHDPVKDGIRLTITKHIPEFLHTILQDKQAQKRETFHVFADVFPMKPKSDTGGEEKGDPKPPPEKEKDYTISRLMKGCGFSVTAGKTKVPNTLIIHVGYWQERKGKEQCIKAYNPNVSGFDVAHMETHITGAEITHQNHNKIRLNNVQPNFKFSITGFNPIFDLVVDVKEADNETDS